MVFGGFRLRKTKPIYSFSVRRPEYCEMEFEKTNPILRLRSGQVYYRSEFSVLRTAERKKAK